MNTSDTKGVRRSAGESLFDHIQRLRSALPADMPALRDSLAEVERNYSYLLQYALEGDSDPTRDRHLAALREKLRRIEDAAAIESKMQTSADEWFATMRFRRLRGDRLPAMLDSFTNMRRELDALYDAGAGDSKTASRRTEADSLLADIFDIISVSYHLLPEDNRRVRELLLSPTDLSRQADFALRMQAATALMLGGTRVYDEQKLLTFMDMASLPGMDPMLRAVAISGVILMFNKFSGRISRNPEVADRLALWHDDEEMTRAVRDTYIELLRTIDTDWVNKTMTEDVMPKIMKLGPDIVKRMRDASFTADVSSLEDNPEWADLLDKTGIRSKLEQLTEMQIDGADVMAMAFSKLKQFPFFNRAANWFLPFDRRHSAVAVAPDGNLDPVADVLASGAMLCDSDSYSLALAFRNMDPAMLGNLTANMSAQFEQMKEATAEASLYARPDGPAECARKFVRNLYRFLKIYGTRKEEDKDFGVNFLASESAPIKADGLGELWQAVSDRDFCSLVGAFYFKRRMFKEALPLLKSVDSGTEAGITEQVGFCYERLGLYDNAIASYDLALASNPDSKWLLRRYAHALQHCSLPDYAKAASIYKKLVADDTSNEKMLMRLARCQYLAGNYDEALQTLYKVNYLFPANTDAENSIAWCELRFGNTAKAADLYMRLLLTNPSGDNYLHAGLAAMSLGKRREALGYFKEAIRIYGLKEFDAAAAECMPMLEESGIDIEAFRLFRDKAALDLNSYNTI